MRVLCATDLLPKSESAINRTGMLAGQLNADLSLLHVVTPPESDGMLEQDLQSAREQLKSRARPPLWLAGPAPNVLVRTGSPARILIQTAKEMAADLIVLGTHRKRPARDALAGTIAERVLSEHQCPVLIVKRKPKNAYRNILLALDRSASSTSALRAAESLVLKDPAVRATVVHALEPPYEQMLTSAGIGANAITLYADAWKREASTVLRDLLKQASNDFSRYALILEEARPAAAVQKAAGRINPDLLVLGTRGHGRIRRTLLGSVANRILASASTDVLIVPDGSEGGNAQRRRLDRLSLEVIAEA
jgi:universal stress protein E